MDKLKYIKLKNEDGSYTDSIPLAVDSDHVDVNGSTLTNTLGTLATKTEVQAIASGSPAGVYATVAALTSADPDHSKIYVVSADGHWYYYSNNTWTDGGLYQSSSDTNRVNFLQDNMNYYGCNIDFILTGGSVTSSLYLEAGKTYLISRLLGDDNGIRGQLFIEGYPSYSVTCPYITQTPTVQEFTPTQSGLLRFYNASSGTGTLKLRILGEFDSIKNDTFLNTSYINGYTINEVGVTKAYVKAGDKIKIKVSSNTATTNLFVSPYVGGDKYISLLSGSGIYYFTAEKDGYIALQMTQTSISAKIFVFNGIIKENESYEEVYIVDKNGGGDYTSFTAMEEDLKNNFNDKIVYVRNGEYDIYEELGGDAFIATITDPSNVNWRDVCKIVPPNTHIIGLGDVILKFAPEASKIGSNAMAFLFSPLNVSYSCTIENIRVFGSNCRYAIHDESSGYNTYANTIHKYINVTAEKEHGTYGNPQVFGSGLARNCYWEFDGCTFKSDRSGIWTCHTVTSIATDVSKIFFNNCIFANYDESSFTNTDTIQFISGSSEGHQSVKNIIHINNSYVTGKIGLTGDAGATQRYQLTTLKTTSNGIRVDENLASNPYPPKEYN